MAHRTTPSSFRVQKFLGGLRYPAGKPQILAHAREKGADEQTLRALDHLPERDYESPVSLSCEVGRIAHAC